MTNEAVTLEELQAQIQAAEQVLLEAVDSRSLDEEHSINYLKLEDSLFRLKVMLEVTFPSRN